MTSSHLGSLRPLRALSWALGLSLLSLACGSDSDGGGDEPGGNAGASGGSGKGGSAGAAGTAGKGGAAGAAGAAGNAGTAGTSGGSAGSAGSAGTTSCPGSQQSCDGACVDTKTDPNNCGACGKVCATRPGDSYSCQSGACVFQGCKPGYGDCNKKPDDGCEADLAGATACACEPGATQPCYDGPDGSEGKGTCVGGTRTCTEAGTGYGPCVGQKIPSADLCSDDLDQDCDGYAYKCVLENEVCGASGTCVDPCDPGQLGTSYIGCIYYPTVTPNLVAPDGFDFAVAVSNTNDTAVTVTVTRGATPVAQTTVGPASVAIVKMPWIQSLKGPSQYEPYTMYQSVRENDGAYKLVASRPVTVYQYSPLQYQKESGGTSFGDYSYTNDASLLLPVNAWRFEYVVASSVQWQGSSGFYAVVAAQDGTTVTLSPGARLQQVKGGVAGLETQGTGTVVLDEGDELLVLAGGSDGQSDITGSRVKADKPIQVIGGHQCTNIPYSVTACDHLEESMFPVDTLAREYLAVSPSLPQGGVKANIIRFIATEPDTTFTYDPAPPGAPAGIAQAGDFIEFQTDQNFQVKGNKRFLMAQYALGQDAGGGVGDPDMTLVVPTAQYRTDYLFHAPVSYETNFVNITAPLNATITLDGNVVSGFAPIGGTSYGAVRVQLPTINDGNHTITGDQPFGITVYGFGSYTSYWYPGGLDLDEIKE